MHARDLSTAAGASQGIPRGHGCRKSQEPKKMFHTYDTIARCVRWLAKLANHNIHGPEP